MTGWRWQAPPTWPLPPPGFLPPDGWQPSAYWLPAPKRWRFWRRTPAGHNRLVAAWGCLGFVVLFLVVQVVGTFDHRGDHDAFVARRDRGVVAQALLLSSHYDASGGDPDGWTREVVLIPTAQGKVRAVVGHHGPESGEVPTSVAVIYDPLAPTNAQTLQDFTEYGDYSDGLGFRGSVGLAAGFGLVTAGVLALGVVVLHRRPVTPLSWTRR
jgi:hypothetical protein